MTDRVEPALSGYEWSHVRRGGDTLRDAQLDAAIEGVRRLRAEHMPALIALANAALPDSDPRKITREMVAAMRDAAHSAESRHDRSGELVDYETQRQFEQWADALSSYLPPEPEVP
jgi:hypothetical protein